MTAVSFDPKAAMHPPDRWGIERASQAGARYCFHSCLTNRRALATAIAPRARAVGAATSVLPRLATDNVPWRIPKTMESRNAQANQGPEGPNTDDKQDGASCGRLG